MSTGAWAWLLVMASVVLGVISIPVDGPAGIAIGLTAIVLGVLGLRAIARSGGGR